MPTELLQLVTIPHGAPIMRAVADEYADVALLARLERIKKLADDLARTQADSVDAKLLADRIKREVDAAKAALQTLETHPPKT